jgi:maltooligosyltrehalose trehalohydrolase
MLVAMDAALQDDAAGPLQPDSSPLRRLPVGAEITSGGTHFCVWAPRRKAMSVVIENGGEHPMRAEDHGYFSLLLPHCAAGTRYRLRLDGGDSFPDPASRFQPEGPHGPSEVVDPHTFAWSDEEWRGVSLPGAVVYELHVGTFTPEGTWDAARLELPRLVELGTNVLEIMPVAEFPGRFGWGYDGVDQFAPSHLYGRPDDFRRFVDAAHGLGLAVVLDVVYNHFGPDGNYLKQFSDTYFTDAYETDWGEPINFHGPGSKPVREFFLANVRHWIGEYHLDGLRLDATQSIFDRPEDHILAAISRVARDAAHPRSVILIGENEPQETRLVRPLDQGGYGLDALWNDDFHHSAIVALTGRREAYYTDYMGTPQELVSAMKRGYLYQGQRYAWQKQRRGTSSFDLVPSAFVTFLENHDQVANSARGLRRHQQASPGRYRALTALVLLGPGTPMLFQGQEYAASTPFLYFADHAGELGDKVASGRREFLEQFPSIATPAWRGALPRPNDPETFRRSVLDPAEREENMAALALHRDLLRLRREDEVVAAQGRHGFDGAVIGARAFALRFFGETHGDDRLLLVNLGPDLTEPSLAEPLLAPPTRSGWDVAWSSEDPRYGGCGVVEPETAEGWHVSGESAVLLRPSRRPLPAPSERRRLPRVGWR